MNNLNVFGLKVTDFNIPELKSYLVETIKEQKKIIIFGYGLGLISQFKKHPEIYLYGNTFDIMLTDGRLYFLFLKLLGYRLQSDLSIPQLIRMILKIADNNSFSIMLIGAKKEVNLRANENLKKEFTNLIVHPGLDGYFDDTDENNVINHIKKYQPNILLVGMTSPKKEIFVATNRESLNVNIIIPCGGMIDVLSGRIKQTPTLLKKIGLATIYRVVQEPKRLFLKNVWETYEIIFKIIPISLYYRYIKKDNKFFLPSIYNIPEHNDL